MDTMEHARTRPHRVDDPVMHLPKSRVDLRFPQTRAEMLGYFAWGYLSRRELNERLQALQPSPPKDRQRRRGHHSRAA
jgi:hypothetical protein